MTVVMSQWSRSEDETSFPDTFAFKRSEPLASAQARLRVLIEDIVANVFSVEPEQLRRSTRGRAKIALARQVGMYIAHVGYGMSLTEVGRLFDRDRTTVAHACGVVEVRRDDPDFDEAVVLLELIVRAVDGSSMHGAASPASSVFGAS